MAFLAGAVAGSERRQDFGYRNVARERMAVSQADTEPTVRSNGQ
jgi:hypothetical protein